MKNILDIESTKLEMQSSANTKALILGISVFGHDSSCSLINGETGDILYAITEERFSNVKHDGGFPTASLELLLKKIELENLGEIKYLALNIDPEISLDRLKLELNSCLDDELADLWIKELDELLATADLIHPDYYPLNYLESLLTTQSVDSSLIAEASEKLSWYGNFIIRHRKLKHYLQYKFPHAVVSSVGHHQCHAASSFYCSDFETAAVLTVDGQGEDATLTLNIAQKNEIKVLSQTKWPNSLGALYMQLAWYLGFDGDARYPGFGDEFKVMGMAAYGKPIYVDIFREMGQVSLDGTFQLIYGNYLEIVEVEGCPGHSQARFTEQFFKKLGPRRISSEPIEQCHYDIAYSGQLFLEEIAVDVCKHLKFLTPSTENLCIAGGVGLNGLMNMRIFQEAGFKNIFIQPASGDDGTSLGAALHVYHSLIGSKRCKPLSNAYLGFEYDDDLIKAALENYGLIYQKPKSIHAEMGRLLNDGKIIARYYGRGEFGPRALGHRSILANPTLSGMKNAVNAKIKHREAFRPFAPACLEEVAGMYFDIDIPTPYMLLICQARPGVRELVPAVVHDDGTARLQTVSQDHNSDFYKTIVEFNRHSGVPILLNTSFNVNGEAIVETPQDAIESFLFMDIDYLAIGPYIVSKESNENSALHEQSRLEHIENRKARYRNKYFSKEMFLWSTRNPVETDLALMSREIEVYKHAAEQRLSVIEILDAEIKRLQNTN